MSIANLIKTAEQKLQSLSKTPRLDAEILLAQVLKQNRVYLHAHPEKLLTTEENTTFDLLLERRSRGEPIAYILGFKEFWSLNLLVTPDVLIPRPETELLVERVLERLPKDDVFHVADLGTGSGAIALAIASARPNCLVIACDISSRALAVAAINAERLQIKNVKFLNSDWCQALPNNAFDVIVSNPPYIATSDPTLQGVELQFEPSSALFAGIDGLDALRIVIAQAKDKLKLGGYLFLEHGAEQGKAVEKILQENAYTDIADYADLAGLSRVAQGRKVMINY
jgi:release factor glutamine methyltransferase